jgi:hypothetical protein
MTNPHSKILSDRIIDTMVEVAGISRMHRVIVTGSDSLNVYLGMLRRGFYRVANTAICRTPCGQHDIAIVAGQHSDAALATMLTRVMPFLTTAAVIVVWCQDRGSGAAAQRLLERVGFRIELGTRCEHGFVLAARRREPLHLANVA